MDISPRNISRFEFVGCTCSKSAKGASFCQVDRMRPVVRSRPWRTSGSHECSGAKPSFRARAIVIIVIGRGCEVC